MHQAGLKPSEVEEIPNGAFFYSNCARAFRPQAGTSTLSPIFIFVIPFHRTVVRAKPGQSRPCNVSGRALGL